MAANKLNDKWLTLIGIPLFAFFATVVFYSDEWLIRHHPFIQCYFVSLINTAVIWMANRVILIVLRGFFPSIKQTFSRVWRQIIFSTLLSIILSITFSSLNDYFQFIGRDFHWKDYLYNIIVVLFFVYCASAIYELKFYFREWQNSVKEAEQLKKANLQSQFDSLKSQVSPHFLFNSLNTLSSLIEEDSTKAVQFVNQLSRVYRYLLQSNEKELSTLSDELDFLRAYFFLLKTRFDDGISMELNIENQFMQYLIPPLTLQILVENAVKHNVVSVSKPLKIELHVSNDNYLHVVNNVQKKTIHVISNGLGLANISAKYKLLNKPGIVIEENNTLFTVTLPLLNN